MQLDLDLWIFLKISNLCKHDKSSGILCLLFSLPLGTGVYDFWPWTIFVLGEFFSLLEILFYLALQRNPQFYVSKNSAKIRGWSLGCMQPNCGKIFGILLRKCLTFSLCKFLPKTYLFSKTSQMIFPKGGEHLDTSTRHTCTSGKNLGQNKNVLLVQTANPSFGQCCFLKILVGPTFKSAKSLFGKLVGLEFWRKVTRTSSRLELWAERTMSMPTLAGTGPCQKRHGHGRGRRPIVVTGVLLPRPLPSVCYFSSGCPAWKPSTTTQRLRRPAFCTLGCLWSSRISIQ